MVMLADLLDRQHLPGGPGSIGRARGMAGRTDMVVGRRHNRFVHVPIDVVASARNEVAPDGDLWLSVLESTAQPLELR